MLPILPPEIVSLIINHVDKKDLYNCTLTSKQFYTFANPLLWQEPNVRSAASFIKIISSIFVSKQPLGQYVRRLDFCEKLTNAEFLLFLEHVPQLEELEMMNGHLITDDGFKHFPQRCPNLKSLDLSDVSITQQSFDLLGQHCLQLRMLRLSGMLLSPNTFAALVDCPLEELFIRFDTGTGQQQLRTGQQDSMLIPGISQLHLLTTLKITDYSNQFIYDLVTARDPTGQTPWPHLTEFYVDEYRSVVNDIGAIDEQLYIDFIRSHPSLTSICLPYESVSESILDIFPTLVPGLKHLGLECCGPFSSQSIRTLIRGLPLLEELNIGGCGILGVELPEVDEDGLLGKSVEYLNQANIDRIRLASGSTDNEHINQLGDPTPFGNDEETLIYSNY